MKYLYLIIIFIAFLQNSYGQSSYSNNYLSWSAVRRLTPADFAIKINEAQAITSFAQFFIDFQVAGFDFMTKNFNKKVHNYFIKSASWIDTSRNVEFSLQYQQTLFDLCEIYTRQFRKELKENRKKIFSGMEFVKELNARAMTQFSNRRLEYDADTQYGYDKVKQHLWQAQIQMELTDLKDFASE